MQAAAVFTPGIPPARSRLRGSLNPLRLRQFRHDATWHGKWLGRAVASRIAIRHLLVSSGHNYFGHHGRPAGTFAAHDVSRVALRARRGIEGDRFFGFRDDYKGQVTLFAWEVYEAAKARFAVPELAAAAVRRNIVIEGLDLPALVGARFALGGVELLGTEESRPCSWMNEAVAPGAEAWLRGNGGLRARVLTDGELCVGPVSFSIITGQAMLPV